ncbi:MAG: MlaD family protein [Actinomycetota bacterium]|nr:MlaD family protein [Actinomycetota bacterium]
MKDHRKVSRYNQQFFRDWGGPGPLFFGILAVLLVAVGIYMAFAKSIPFTSPGYEVKATFANAVNIADKSPVRIAGINVGKVTGKEGSGNNTVVSFTVEDEGQPLHKDASAQIRPRLFLEGNWFIDLDPGTPEAGELEDDGTIPITRTSTSVQIGDVLRTFQIPERANLQKLLIGLGAGLNSEPTAAQDLTFEPSVQGLTGGEALNLAYRNGETAARGTAVVAAAYLGEKPNDLGNLLRGLGRLTGTINERQDDVQGFVRNFETFTGALAAESTNLSSTIRELPDTLTTARTSLTNLNAALPALRGFAIAITPAINEVPRTIRTVRPLTNQLKPLLTQRELGGLAQITRRNAPAAATSINETLRILPQIQNLGLCVSENLVPTGDQVIEDGAHGNGQPASREALYAAVSGAGSAATFDGNGPFVRFQVGGGPVSVKMRDPVLRGDFEWLYGRLQTAPLGTTPADNGQPPLVGSELCHTQDVPDLNGPAANAGPPSPAAYTP